MKSILTIINEEILSLKKLQNLNEDFNNNKLYGYHCTPCANLESIETNGFKIGSRNMQGDGVYAFYNLKDNSSGNAALGYGSRHIGYEFCIVKFEIEYPQWLLILNKKIAEEVLGNNADIVKQIDNNIRGGYESYLKYIKQRLRPEFITPDFDTKHLDWLREKFDIAEHDGRELMFGISNLEPQARFGIIYDGEYGIQYLIKSPSIMLPIGYYNVSRDSRGNTTISEFIPFTGNGKIKQIIDSDDKYKSLRNYNISTSEDISVLKHKFNDKLLTVRNNRDYDAIQNMINLLDSLV